MKDKTAETNRCVKQELITIDDDDSPSGPSESVPSLDVAQLQRELVKERERSKFATGIAGEFQARVISLESSIDNQRAVQEDAVKEAEELRKRLDEFGKQFDAEKKKWEAKAEENEQMYTNEIRRGESRAKDDKERFDEQLTKEKNKAADQAKADKEQLHLVSAQLEEEKKKGEAKAAADKQNIIDEISSKLSEEKKNSAAKSVEYKEKLNQISAQLHEEKKNGEAKAAADKQNLDLLSAELEEEREKGQARDAEIKKMKSMLDNEWRRVRNEKERGVKRAEDDRQLFEGLFGELEAERAKGESKDAQEVVLKRENAQLKEELAELKRRLDESEIAKNTPKEEPIDINQPLPQDYQISASEIMREEKMFKNEELNNENAGGITQYSNSIASDSLDNLSTTPNFSRSLPLNSIQRPTGISQAIPKNKQISEMAGTDIPFEASPNKLPFNDYEAANRTMHPSDFMDDPMNFDDQIADDREATATENDSLNDSPFDGMDGMGQSENQNELMEEQEKDNTDNQPIGIPKVTFETDNGEENGRPSRNVSRPKRYSQCMDTSDEVDDPSMGSSRSEEDNGRKKRRASLDGSFRSKSVVKKRKMSDAAQVQCSAQNEIQCPECEFYTQSVGSWEAHLRGTHNTTPYLAGFALLCKCGNEGYSSQHRFHCKVANLTVIRKRDGPIQRMDDEKTTPQCILCEVYPKTPLGYIAHLNLYHKTTLRENDIYLKCACDFEFQRKSSHQKHDKNCNGRQFALHMRDEQ